MVACETGQQIYHRKGNIAQNKSSRHSTLNISMLLPYCWQMEIDIVWHSGKTCGRSPRKLDGGRDGGQEGILLYNLVLKNVPWT